MSVKKSSQQKRSLFFEILSDLNQAVPNHLADESFRAGGPQSPFSISSSFILSFVLLPFLLNTKKKCTQLGKEAGGALPKLNTQTLLVQFLQSFARL